MSDMKCGKSQRGFVHIMNGMSSYAKSKRKEVENQRTGLEEEWWLYKRVRVIHAD